MPSTVIPMVSKVTFHLQYLCNCLLIGFHLRLLIAENLGRMNKAIKAVNTNGILVFNSCRDKRSTHVADVLTRWPKQ